MTCTINHHCFNSEKDKPIPILVVPFQDLNRKINSCIFSKALDCLDIKRSEKSI